MGRVENKVAIVTGAASGLGFAAARKLMDEGAKVLLTDINEEVINSMPERLSNYSETQFSSMAHDVANEESWINVIENAENQVQFDRSVQRVMIPLIRLLLVPSEMEN